MCLGKRVCRVAAGGYNCSPGVCTTTRCCYFVKPVCSFPNPHQQHTYKDCVARLREIEAMRNRSAADPAAFRDNATACAVCLESFPAAVPASAPPARAATSNPSATPIAADGDTVPGAPRVSGQNEVGVVCAIATVVPTRSYWCARMRLHVRFYPGLCFVVVVAAGCGCYGRQGFCFATEGRCHCNRRCD